MPTFPYKNTPLLRSKLNSVSSSLNTIKATIDSNDTLLSTLNDDYNTFETNINTNTTDIYNLQQARSYVHGELGSELMNGETGTGTYTTTAQDFYNGIQNTNDSSLYSNTTYKIQKTGTYYIIYNAYYESTTGIVRGKSYIDIYKNDVLYESSPEAGHERDNNSDDVLNYGASVQYLFTVDSVDEYDIRLRTTIGVVTLTAITGVFFIQKL